MDSRKRRRNALKIAKNAIFAGLSNKKVLVPAHAVPGCSKDDERLFHGRIKVSSIGQKLRCLHAGAHAMR
jgi:hypothetical protein